MVWTATIQTIYTAGQYWAVDARDTFTGADTQINLLGSIPDITYLSKDLIVDGLAIRYIRGGGGVTVTPAVYGFTRGLTMTHYLENFTTTATSAAKAYTPLGIPIQMTEGQPFVVLGVTTVALDLCNLSVWGRYNTPPPTEFTPPAPVSIQKIEVWPWKRG